MEVNKAAWEKLKKQIEFHTEQDGEITDVQINYQVKPGKKNYLKLNITIDKWDKITGQTGYKQEWKNNKN